MARRVMHAPKHAQTMPTGLGRTRRAVPWHVVSLLPALVGLVLVAGYLIGGAP